MATGKTKSQKTNDDITALLRAKNTFLWVSSVEEVRVERALVDAAAAAKYDVAFWDCVSGLTLSNGKRQPELAQATAVLEYIRNTAQRRVYVLRDLNNWWDPVIFRALRNLARELQGKKRDEARAIVVLTPSTEVPPDLAGHVMAVDYPIPERPEIGAILDDIVRSLPEDIAAKAIGDGERDAAIDAAVGLTAEEASSCYAKSIVTLRRIDANEVAAEKKRVITRERVLTWIDPDPRGLDAVGGLDVLKTWLRRRQSAFSQAARDYGLPAPKGVLLLGHPGCGKSLTAKAVASAWGMPLLRFDMGALRSKFVGDSEANIRRALQVAEAVAPAVLWVDEIEKALAGATGPAGDGGVAADQLGTLLSWMQDRQGSVFVIATANDVRSLPPELLRKGRFDEIFFTDLPTETERREIVRAALRQHGRDPDAIQGEGWGALAARTQDFTGAEIAAIVPDALFAAFSDGGREITVNDLVVAAESVVPLSKTAAERIEGLRKWAEGRARFASTREKAQDLAVGRALDFT